ncbi:MAG: DUF502 domain-containing protein [Dehalococcoidales bacterium]
MKKEGESSGHWLLRNLRRNFLAGILVVVPLGIVVFILVWFFVNVDNILQPIIKTIFGNEIIGLGFAVSLILIYLIGLFASNIVGQKLISFGESILAKVPVLRQIYTGAKQVIASLSGTSLNKAAFREVVLVEFPRAGMKTIAFITNEVKDKSGQKLLMIYIPTAPVPTSGYFEIVTEDMVTRTDIGVDEAMQMVISSGMSSPAVIDTKMPPKKDKPPGEQPTLKS